MTNKTENIFHWVLTAKGIGIILVVIGHFHPDAAPEYWMKFRDILYTFHMPLFFMLSGFLYKHAKYSYPTLIKIKIRRLLYPFITIAAIFFILKYFSGLFFRLEYPVGLDSIFALFLDPVNSYKPLLWFVHALFIIFLVFPLLRNIIKNNFVILAIFILLNILIGNDYLIIGKALANIPFFIVGTILRENNELLNKIASKNWARTIALAVIFFATYLISEIAPKSSLDYILRLILGLSGAICVINISILIDAKGKWLEEIGFYSMTIYLFHTLFESAVRISFYQVLDDLYVKFEIIAFIAIAAGIVFPLILEKMILRKNKFTKKYILGLS